MSKQNWKTVFEQYPNAGQIFVCAGQPFLTRKDAAGHSRSTGEPVETVDNPQIAAEKEAAEKEAAEKAKADKKTENKKK